MATFFGMGLLVLESVGDGQFGLPECISRLLGPPRDTHRPPVEPVRPRLRATRRANRSTSMTRRRWIPLRDRLDAVVSLDLERDDRAVDMDHPGAAGHGEALRGRGEMLDLDERPDAPLVLLQAGGDRVAGRVLEMGDQPGGRQDRGHPRIGEADPIVEARPSMDLLARSDPIRGFDFIGDDLALRDDRGTLRTESGRLAMRTSGPNSTDHP